MKIQRLTCFLVLGSLLFGAVACGPSAEELAEQQKNAAAAVENFNTLYEQGLEATGLEDFIENVELLDAGTNSLVVTVDATTGWDTVPESEKRQLIKTLSDMWGSSVDEKVGADKARFFQLNDTTGTELGGVSAGSVYLKD